MRAWSRDHLDADFVQLPAVELAHADSDTVRLFPRACASNLFVSGGHGLSVFPVRSLSVIETYVMVAWFSHALREKGPGGPALHFVQIQCFPFFFPA